MISNDKEKKTNKHNAELQWADPGTKVTGNSQFSTRSPIKIDQNVKNYPINKHKSHRPLKNDFLKIAPWTRGS